MANGWTVPLILLCFCPFVSNYLLLLELIAVLLTCHYWKKQPVSTCKSTINIINVTNNMKNYSSLYYQSLKWMGFVALLLQAILRRKLSDVFLVPCVRYRLFTRVVLLILHYQHYHMILLLIIAPWSLSRALYLDPIWKYKKLYEVPAHYRCIAVWGSTRDTTAVVCVCCTSRCYMVWCASCPSYEKKLMYWPINNYFKTYKYCCLRAGEMATLRRCKE